MISVAAELADMHPQTLRMYEQRGLIEPKRSPKGTRLYSHEDVERLRRIQQMTAELGLNLAGVEKVLELEQQLERTRRRVAALERRRAELEAEIAALEGRREQVKAEIVRYEAAKGSALVRAKDIQPVHDPDRADRRLSELRGAPTARRLGHHSCYGRAMARTQTMVQLTQELVESLDALAARRAVSRSALIREFVVEGLAHGLAPPRSASASRRDIVGCHKPSRMSGATSRPMWMPPTTSCSPGWTPRSARQDTSRW